MTLPRLIHKVLSRFLSFSLLSPTNRFWLAVQDLKKQPLQDVTTRVEEIWQEFLAPGAQSAINLDSHSYEKTSQNVKDPGRYTYEDAQVCFWFCGTTANKTLSFTVIFHYHIVTAHLLEKGEAQLEVTLRISLQAG